MPPPAGLGPTSLLLLEKQHIPPPIGEVEGGGTTCGTRPNNNGVAGPKRHGKWWGLLGSIWIEAPKLLESLLLFQQDASLAQQ